MSSRRLILALLALAAAAAGGAGAGGVLDGGGPERPPAGARGESEAVGRVVRVVDGDTIHVQVGDVREKVRYIGIDTPETKDPRRPVQCYGQRASNRNAALVDGERVRLVPDVRARDRYGRLLAYVYRARDGLFVNEDLVRRGYARALRVPPDVRHSERFAALAREAEQRGLGLWSAC